MILFQIYQLLRTLHSAIPLGRISSMYAMPTTHPVIALTSDPGGAQKASCKAGTYERDLDVSVIDLSE